MKNRKILETLTIPAVLKPPRVLGSISVPPVKDVVISREFRSNIKSGLSLDLDYFFESKIKKPLIDEVVSVDYETKFEVIQVFQDMPDGLVVDLLKKPNQIDVRPFFAVIYKLMRDQLENPFGRRGLSQVNANIFKINLGISGLATVSVFWFEGERKWYFISEKYSRSLIRHRGNILYSLVL